MACCHGLWAQPQVGRGSVCLEAAAGVKIKQS